jgi:hypothetical protein
MEGNSVGVGRRLPQSRLKLQISKQIASKIQNLNNIKFLQRQLQLD